MKPLGMTATFRVAVPSRVEDAIWNAVQEAILQGWTAKRFRAEAADAWEHELKEAAKTAVQELTR